MPALTRSIGSLGYLALGAGSAILGLLPWLISGMRLPLQNLWATQTLPAQMPLALLPFSQYYLTFIVALLLIGSTIAGIVGRATTARHPRHGLLALMGGVLLVQAIATVQTVVTVSWGLDDSAASSLYLVALVGGIVFAILLGLGMLALIARAPRARALVALSIAAIAFGSWFSGLIFPVGTITTASPFTSVMSEISRLLPAIIIGAAIAWCGITTVGRVIAGVVSLAALWVGPTLVTAVSSAAGSRVLAPYPAEMLDYGVQVFRSALGMPELWLPTLGLALGVAVIGLVGQRTLAKRAAAAA